MLGKDDLTMMSSFPVRLLVSVPGGAVSLTPEKAGIALPRGPDYAGPLLTYGSYFDAIMRFLGQERFAPLRESLSMQLGRSVPLESIRALDVISEKHGAIYHVVHLRVHLPGEVHSLVVNVATLPEQQAFLESEVGLLRELHERFGLSRLPRPYLRGEAAYVAENGERQRLELFFGEWFEGFHELHLSARGPEGALVLRMWNAEGGDRNLSVPQAHSFYRRAAGILTSYLDPDGFRQIYPWHHAAGDFIVRLGDGEDVDVRMVTARDYRCLVPVDSDELWIGIVHFFFNMTIRMRVDRLDGTGGLAWAVPDCLDGVIEGFLEAWGPKAAAGRAGGEGLPGAGDVLEVLRSFSPEEWQPLSEIIVGDGMVEAEEQDLLRARMESHIAELCAALEKPCGAG